MNELLTLTLTIVAFGLAIPIAVFAIECGAALFDRPPSPPPSDSPEPRISVLIPAHNEAAGIAATLADVRAQLKETDEAIVIADNCSDETAAIAREKGATAIERQDRDNRGKGYALDFGLRHLQQNPPDVVVMVDADCRVEPGAIATVARKARETGNPVQALYLMETPADPSVKQSISAFAFLVKNGVRPRGLARMGGPCALTGTGMAFPWSSLQSVSLADGNIVEDMQLGVDLAIAGHPPQFTAEAKVLGLLPKDETATTSQRTRWEHGHLETLQTQVPRLLKAAIRQGRPDLLQMALDLCVPPLSLLALLWAGSGAIAVLVGILGLSWTPALMLAAEGILLFLAILLAWGKFGRSLVSLKTLSGIPSYILWKIPLYLKFFVKPQKEWVRTERDLAPESDGNRDN